MKRMIIAITATSVLSFIVGAILGWHYAQPSKTIMDGKVYQISPRYELVVWFHETNEIRELNIADKYEKRDLLSVNFYTTGILKGISRKVADGFVGTAYDEEGRVKFISYRGSDEVLKKREYFDEKGELEKVEEF